VISLRGTVPAARSSLIRRVVPGALIVLTGLGLSACQTDASAAAIIGNQRISVDRLAGIVKVVLADPTAAAHFASDVPGLQRQELSRLINSIVTEQAAAARGITATAAEVDQELVSLSSQTQAANPPLSLAAAAIQAGIPAADIPGFARDQVLRAKLTQLLVANIAVPLAQLQAAYRANIDSYDQVHAAHILVKDKATADRILAAVLKNPGTFAALAKQYSIDTSNKNSGGDLGFAGRGQFVKPFADAIFSHKPGSFIEVHSQFGWHVVHVIARRTITLAQAEPGLRTQLLQSQGQTAFGAALEAEAKLLHITVNPRFGHWNATTGTVDVTPDTVSVPASPTAPPAGGAGSS